MEKGRYAVFWYTKKIMADGNYNRNILPYHNYQSGYRAGRAAMRRLALEAFDKWLQENEEAFPGILQRKKIGQGRPISSTNRSPR